MYIEMMVCQLQNGDKTTFSSLYRLLPNFPQSSYSAIMDVLLNNVNYKRFVPYELYVFLINRMNDLGCLFSSIAQLCLDLFAELEVPDDPDFQSTNLMNACMICINTLPASIYESRLKSILESIIAHQVHLCQLLEMVCILQKSGFFQGIFDFHPVFDHLFEMLLSELRQNHYAMCSGLLIAYTFFVSYGFNFNPDLFAELWNVLWNHSDQRFILNHLKEIQELVMLAPPAMYEKIMQGMLKDNRLDTLDPKCWLLVFRIWKAINDVYHFFELGNAIESLQGYVETGNRVNDRNSERSCCILSFS